MRVVLRLKKGSPIRLVDEQQTQYTARVEQVTNREVLARIIESHTPEVRQSARLSVIQGIPRLPKADWITQKLTELGIQSIVFAPTEYTPYRDGFDRMCRRLSRLRTIAETAAKQCARRDIPSVSVHADLKKAAETAAPGTIFLVADEKAPRRRLCDLFSQTPDDAPLAVFIGPEGGLSEKEKEYLQDLGASGFSLGQNILRTETAAITASAIILYELGVI
ncbi:MAG: 16S rRNA (uracil(1498)-N(3))-methyltransferase [Candidatus Abyssubacteria bacterium]